MKRRSFVKGVSALAAFPAVSAWASEEKMFKLFAKIGSKPNFVQNGVVTTAAHWGGLSVTVENGKIVKSTNVFKNRMYNCLQEYTEDLVYAEDRVRYPMVRKSYLDNPSNPKPELRGTDPWVKVSWDEAVKLAGSQIKKAYKKGPNSIFAGSHGWSSSGNLHRAEKLVHRFFRASGGFVSKSGNYSMGATMAITPYVTGKIDVFSKPSAWPTILENSEVVVIWGANPMSTNKASYNSVDSMLPEYHRKLKESGKKIIIIDPVYSETCEYYNVKKDTTWFRPRPNTDTALMIAMCHTLYVENKYDQDFIEEYTEGFDVFKDYFTGKTDGIVKDAKWASEICDIPEKTIKELSNTFKSNRTMLMMGWSLQRQHHGEQRHWGIITLAAMIGQIGLPGGGFGLTYHQGGSGVPGANNVKLGSMGAKSKFEKKAPPSWAIPVARISDMLLNPGKTIDYNGKKVTYEDIDLIYWAGGNPFSHHQDLNTLSKAWQKANTVIVNEMYWTATARMADIVFPATTPYERNDIVQGGDESGKYIYPMKAVVPAQYESKDDFEIFKLLAKELGGEVHKLFTENKSQMDWISGMYDSARKQALAKGIKMPVFRKFWADNKPFEFKASSKGNDYVSYADFREDPLLNPLGTDSGKFEIYSQRVASYKYDDCPGHVTWMEPVEWLGQKKKPAPLALVSPHPGTRLHSQLDNTSLRHTYEIQGREPIWINTEDAKERGINNGDLVEVFNKRGSTLAGAFVTNRITKGVVRMQEGGWYDPLDRRDEKTICKHGCVNTLTIDIASSKLAVATSAHTALVDVKKFKGKAPELSIFKQPKTV